MAILTDNNLQQIRGIVRDETRNEFKDIKEELYRQGVFLESLQHDFKAVTELLSMNFNVKNQVEDHETRLQDIEILQALLRKIVKDHSRQLRQGA